MPPTQYTKRKSPNKCCTAVPTTPGCIALHHQHTTLAACSIPLKGCVQEVVADCRCGAQVAMPQSPRGTHNPGSQGIHNQGANKGPQVLARACNECVCCTTAAWPLLKPWQQLSIGCGYLLMPVSQAAHHSTSAAVMCLLHRVVGPCTTSTPHWLSAASPEGCVQEVVADCQCGVLVALQGGPGLHNHKHKFS
jgi:hypothetical protein